MKKSKFDLSHERKMSLNMGQLIPILCDTVLPGDKWRVNTEILLRFAPLLAPIMHRVNVTTHYFFVPNRLLWKEWEDFITGGRDGDLEPEMPWLAFPDASDPNASINGSLADYLGLPTYDSIIPMTNAKKITALPFRAYQLVYNEYYRDQNLSDPVPITKDSGPVQAAEKTELYKIRQRAWEKDYATSCLPWAQRGPNAGAPVTEAGQTIVKAYPGDTPLANVTSLGSNVNGGLTATPGGNAMLRNETEGMVMIEEIRKAWSLKRWLERNARGGARYVEQLLHHWKVISSDARLQRPEYLGGGRCPVVISEVLSTFQTDESIGPYPQGNMAGHGISVGSKNGFSRRFEEHGYVLGIMSVIPKTAYQQGISRKWTRFDKFDWPWPEFAHLGEQEVAQSELYHDPTLPQNSPDPLFGYQERYAEEKFAPSTVHGRMRDNLSYWHMGRIFTAPPVLNESFVMSDPTTRIFAVENADEHHLFCQLYNAISVIKSLPFHGIPR